MEHLLKLFATKAVLVDLLGRSRSTIDRECRRGKWEKKKFPYNRAEFFNVGDAAKSFNETFSRERLLRVAERHNKLAIRSE